MYIEPTYYFDIVMCLDGTDAMAPVIDKIKGEILAFYQKFLDAMEVEDKNIAQYRAKVIVFRNFHCDDEAMTESPFFTFPEQNDKFEQFVNAIEAKGGNGISSNALEAIALALKSDWTTYGNRRRHAVFVFSESEVVSLGECADLTNYPSNMPSDIAQLGAWWEGTDQSLGSTYQPRAGRLVAFVPNAEPWTEIQAWNRYWPVFGALLDEDFDIACVLNLRM